jgi:hypothetical protein
MEQTLLAVQMEEFELFEAESQVRTFHLAKKWKLQL